MRHPEIRVARGALTALVLCLPLSISGAQIALGVALAALVVGEVRGAGRLRRLPLGRQLALVLLAFLLSTLGGGISWGAVDAYRELWIAGTFVAAAALVEDAEDGARLARLLVLCAAAVAVYGIVQHFTGIDAYRSLLGRRPKVRPYEHDPTRFAIVGFFPNYLTYAHSLVVPLGWALAGILAGGGWIVGRRLAALSGLLMGTALVLSTARGAWIAAGAMLIGAMLGSASRARLAIVAGGVVVTLVLFGLSPGLRSEARSVLDLRANAGRLAIYAANVDAIRDHPILGLGLGNYDRKMVEYYARHPTADRRSHAHNSFLQVTAESGLVGLAAFCALFGTVLLRGWKVMGRLRTAGSPQWATAAGAWLGVVGFLTGGLTQHTFGDSECAMAMWLAVGVLLAVWRKSEDDAAIAHPAR